jgi:fatty acid desaturase
MTKPIDFGNQITDKLKIPPIDDPEMLLPSMLWGAIATIKVFGILAILLGVAPWIVSISPWILIILAPLLGVYIYKLTIVMHDCCHNTLFPNPKINTIVGMLCGTFLGTNYKTFTQYHWKHHKNYGCLNDPQKSDYLGLQNVGQKQIIIHLFKPLLGLNLFQKLFQLNTALSDKAIIQHQSQFPKRSSRRTLSDTWLHLGLILVVHTSIFCLVTGLGQVWWLIFLYPSCAATFSLFFSQIRGFCEHIPSPNSHGERHVRTHLPNFIDSLLFYDLNFNYHLEHHLYPQVPSCHLPDIHLKLSRHGIHTKQTLSPSILQTIYNRIAEAPK